ncbi:MAG: hypothetical protein A4E55_01852 [Pelotomaculum sp. PtaU1.Bin035]|nr:MAG: hypothetical protein A4E55_01852 [Pelotomaculum sp. PtaU1.Bin035]
MDRIKSAYEMAMERFKQRKEVPQAEIDRLKYVPVGSAMAANYLRERDYDIFVEIGKYPEEVKGYIGEGIQETLLNNILPPAAKSTQETNIRAMEGLFLMKKDKQAVGEVFSQMNNLFNYYEKASAQVYEQFKENFAAKISATVKSLKNRAGGRIKVDPEKQPGFREEWIKALGHFNSQYAAVLKEQKDKLRKIN